MIIGTSHFVSFESAVRYYKDYPYRSIRAAVMRKIYDGEISLGKPKLKKGERLSLIDGGLRYAITTV